MASDLLVAKAVARTTFARLARVVSAGALSGAGVDEGSLAGRLPMPSICRLVDLVRQTTGFGEGMFGDAVGQAALAAMADPLGLPPAALAERAARAMARPSLPDDRLPSVRTASTGSRVPPAVTTTRRSAIEGHVCGGQMAGPSIPLPLWTSE